MNSSDLSFTDNGTLFLDRDGVINRRIPGGYVSRWEEFEFFPGVPEALKILAGIFTRIILVSNQQGVGKGLMTMENLVEIDRRMKEQIQSAGGWIDASYYAPHLESDHHPDRKPAPGMAFRAKSDFPEIDFSRSIMAGDTASDMEFGRNLGMVTVCIGPEKIKADHYFSTLLEFAIALIPDSGLRIPK